MKSIKVSILALLTIFTLHAFAHDTPTGMHISTKSPQAHPYLKKPCTRWRCSTPRTAWIIPQRRAGRSAICLGTHFPHVLLAGSDEQVAEREKALATRASAARKKTDHRLAGQRQPGPLVPAIQAMNESAQQLSNDKHLHWLPDGGLQLNQNQSQRASPCLSAP